MRNVETLAPLALTVRDACCTLSVGKTTLYELINTGRLRTLRIGRKRLIEAASLRALIDEVSA